jgi:hypothetical protein
MTGYSYSTVTISHYNTSLGGHVLISRSHNNDKLNVTRLYIVCHNTKHQHLVLSDAVIFSPHNF